MNTAKLLNNQINKELESAYLYLSMAAYFESQGYKGFSHWMKKQAQEEVSHAMKIFEYLNTRGISIELGAIDKPKSRWDSCLKAFMDAYGHEQQVTKDIYKVVEAANNEKDYAAVAFLQWYVTEQVEEEASVSEILDQLKMIDGKNKAIYLLDKELGQRE